MSAAPQGRAAAAKEEGMERDVELQIGGKRVPLNIFAKRVILGALLGMLDALKDVDPKQEISLKVGPAKA